MASHPSSMSDVSVIVLAAGSEAILLMTRWDEFGRLPSLLRSQDPQPLVVDGRRLLAPDSVERYEGIGL